LCGGGHGSARGGDFFFFTGIPATDELCSRTKDKEMSGRNELQAKKRAGTSEDKKRNGYKETNGMPRKNGRKITVR
jgi:hypothetical protein